jgi:F0F1-type ATP synthase membrane subunit c/vacuolar-type H+-ATPase subunit K
MRNKKPARFIGIGVAIGAGLGVVFGNIAVGVGLGIVAGVLAAAARSRD